MADEGEKRIISLYGEMRLALELHSQNWQVYRAYIDEHVDFVISRYYCTNCKNFFAPERRVLWSKGKETNKTFPTDLCSECETKSLKFIVRFLQVKTSEGIIKRDKNGNDMRSKKNKEKHILDYSFHAKLRSNIDDRSFYVWIAVVKNEKKESTPYFYIFNHDEISKFDDLTLASYQRTDNQKTTLKISPDGHVHNIGKKHTYDYFRNPSEFFNNFDKLKEILKAD